MTRVAATYAPTTFKDLPSWGEDEHRLAFGAFQRSCERLIVLSRTDSRIKADPALLTTCVTAARLGGSRSNAEARAFFEQHFVPHRVVHDGGAKLLTAYYEPIVEGARTPSKRFTWPLYRRPPDLVTVIEEANRGTANGTFTHMRQTSQGAVPFPTRSEIEQGALKGQGLELAYVEHAVDAFFLQIQGSARIRLTDGSVIRIGYDGKNGHPYTSIGRLLIDKGEIPVERMSLQALQGWLKANPAKAREVMWANKSFVFFREHVDKSAADPIGVNDIMLTAGRSLAVDPAYHAIGLPIYLSSPEIRHISRQRGGFQRLMVAQDVGSAIKGPERGDIYVGSGDKAGQIAGTTKHPGTFFVLLPRGYAGHKAQVAHQVVAPAPSGGSPPRVQEKGAASAAPAASTSAPPSPAAAAPPAGAMEGLRSATHDLPSQPSTAPAKPLKTRIEDPQPSVADQLNAAGQ